MNWHELVRNLVHYSGHFLLPVLVAFVFFKEKWKSVTLLLVATILVDVDHLWATPIFDPYRCSVGFHFLHSYVAITFYILFLFVKQFRVLGIGLLMHMCVDFQDCFW